MADERSYYQPAERINFNLRPSKRIERKMVGEALAAIYRYDSPRRFGYIGMGSYYFSDFILFHRLFGLDKMFSIEASSDSERFEFNKPYKCIEMVWGYTNEKLPTLKVFDERPVICWLDYYDRLTSSVLGDIKTFITKAQVGSALIVTVSCTPFSKKSPKADFLKELPEDLRDVSDKAVLQSAKEISRYMCDVITAAVEAQLVDRNAENPRSLSMRQIVNIYYKDNTPMATFGWLLLDNTRSEKLDADPLALDSPGVMVDGKLTEIISPVLTFREISHLKTHLPAGADTDNFLRSAKPITEDAAKRFAELYRYYPSFADVEE